MAAYINRTVSLMSGGDGPHNRSAASPALDHRGLRQSSENSPLQIFVKAKSKINHIFKDIEDYVKDAVEYMNEIEAQKEIVTSEDVKRTNEFEHRVQGIRDVLKRDHMKVAFFGRTSNGKSSVVNAMLRDKILPSGIGHTTNCFLQVEGSPTDEPYLEIEGSNKHHAVESVGQLAHALCKEKLKESQLVRVFWPKSKCILLKDDVVFVDSPGIDVTPNLDDWIDKHCLDADVFVLVANAESTLMLTEKNFFHKVSTRLSKPNIFILNNRWDASASEPEFLDQVRRQHQERAVDFLVNELKVCTSKEAEERIFFISAKEVLQARLAEQGQVSSAPLTEGFQTRYFEFQDFERKFEECISKSAVKTKFGQHSQRGKYIANELKDILDKIYNDAQSLKAVKTKQRKDLYDSVNYTEQQLMLTTEEMKQKIVHTVEDVEQRVSKAFNDEIRRLHPLIDDFNCPFDSHPTVLNSYKKELHTYVEAVLESNLRSRLAATVSTNMESRQNEMIDRMEKLITDKHKHSASHMIHRGKPFEILFRLNCENLCSDFTEDLEFRFSWGITALIKKFSGNNALALKNRRESPSSGLMPSTPTDQSVMPLYTNNMMDDWSLISRMAIMGVSSQGTMGCLIAAGFLFKTIGWRVVVVTGAVYGCLYLYERVTWTNRAKEKAFKKQYVQHLTHNLRRIIDLTSTNCGHQVQQALMESFARLCGLVDEVTTEMDKSLKELEREITTLDNAGARAKALRNKANYLAHELELFEDAYLTLQH